MNVPALNIRPSKCTARTEVEFVRNDSPNDWPAQLEAQLKTLQCMYRIRGSPSRLNHLNEKIRTNRDHLEH